MIVIRIAVFGALLFSMGACSRTLGVPTAYSSLPPVAVVPASTPAPSTAPSVTAVAPPLVDREEILPLAVMPGDSLGPDRGRRARGVDPAAELAASARARAGWQNLRPMDLLLPAVLASRAVGRPTTDSVIDQTSALGSSKGIPAANPAPVVAKAYDREAAMDRLLKVGQVTTKLICDRC